MPNLRANDVRSLPSESGIIHAVESMSLPLGSR
jgi:hypothetical protein